MIEVTRLSFKTYLAVFVAIAVFVLFQIFAINSTESILTSVAILTLVLGVLLYTTLFNDFYVFLVFLTVITYAYIDPAFNCYLNFVIIQDLPVFILPVIAMLFYFARSKNLELVKSNFGTPLLLMFIASFGLTIWGLVRGNDSYFAIYEFVHFIYLFLAFPIAYFITDSKNYNFLFNTILFAAIIVSWQYIYNGLLISSDIRFTSFHASMFPLLIAILVAKFIFLKGTVLKRVGIIVLIVIYAFGAYGTLTRSVWISMVLALMATVSFYYYEKNYLKLKKFNNYLIFGAALTTVLFLYVFVASSIEAASNSEMSVSTKGEDRIESLSTPTTDASFLMRVEIGYYLFERFINSPIIGEGLGSSVSYKILSDTETYYPDSVWFYYLWKGGLVFFLLSIWLYTRFFKSALRVYRASDDIFVKIYMLAFLGGFTAMMFYGLFAPQMVRYAKLNLIFALVYAFVLAEEKKIK